MKFTVTIREEKRGKHRVPVMALGPLLTESGDGIRIQRNALEWHRRYSEYATTANRETNEVLKTMRINPNKGSRNV